MSIMTCFIYLLALLCYPLVVLSIDLTLVPDQKGTNIVLACITKISSSQIFSRDDQQLVRRIAYTETTDGLELITYSGSNNNGGIWQLSESKYLETKSDTTYFQEIEDTFKINWALTSWVDLRKPFFSALAARLYLELKVNDTSDDFPFSTDIPSQSNFWITMFTNSSKTEDDYAAAAILLNEQERCEVGALDLFYLLDDSGSLTEENFNITKNFIYNMTLNFPVAPDRVRIGLITFEYIIRIRFFLNSFNRREEVLDAIENTPYFGEGTNTSGALDVVRLQGFVESNGARPRELGVPRIAIVVTDGFSFEPDNTTEAAAQLHDTGVIVYAIGISEARETELLDIASDPRYAVSVDSFDERILSALQVSISRVACEVSQSIEIDNIIETTVTMNTTLFVDYPLPTGGITIKVNSTSEDCRVKLFGSTFVTTPNEAFNDISIDTVSYEDIYLNISNVFNNDTATRLFLAIRGGEENPCKVMISAEEGDVSTDPVVVTDLPIIIAKYIGDELDVTCTATGKPKPSSIQWDLNGTMLSSIDRTTITSGDIDELTVSSTLNVKSLNVSDRGNIYTCTGSNVIPSGTVMDSSSFTLQVFDPCPIIGTPDCDQRIILTACKYLNMVNETNVPAACQEILDNNYLY